jgi:enterochelin esterase-like enzyme
MKKALSLILLIGLAGSVFSQQHGKILEDLSVQSKIVSYDVNYCVYLPPGYDESTRKYPVVYLLHGYSDKEWGWVQFGEIQQAADHLIASREIPPMIIVMPDGKVTFYSNDYKGEDPWEDMFIQEFIPHIDASYRTRPTKEFRGLSGLSMGGFGSLMFAMRYPDMFASCAAFSAAAYEDEELIGADTRRSWDKYYGKLFGPLENETLPAFFRERHSVDLAKTKPVEELKKVRYYIDCGDDDFLILGNMALHKAMKQRGIPHEFRVRDGGHSWPYWRSGIIDGLKFLGESFHRN